MSDWTRVTPWEWTSSETPPSATHVLILQSRLGYPWGPDPCRPRLRRGTTGEEGSGEQVLVVGPLWSPPRLRGSLATGPSVPPVQDPTDLAEVDP